MSQTNFSVIFGRQSIAFKNSALGRRIRRELIRELLRAQRDEAAETLSDQR